MLNGCMSAQEHRIKVDEAAKRILEEKKVFLGFEYEDLTIEKPSSTLRKKLLISQDLSVSGEFSYGLEYAVKPDNWPEDNYPLGKTPEKNKTAKKSIPIILSIQQALAAGAANSPEYQEYKEEIFKAALNLNLERHLFKSRLTSIGESEISSDTRGAETISGIETSLGTTVEKQFKNSVDFTAGLAVDLVKLLTQARGSSYGISFDSSISIPLLRGSGKHIRMEPLTLAERQVANRIYEFKRFQRIFTVDIIRRYLNILEQYKRTQNYYENYKSLGVAVKKSESLKNAGRIIEIDLDRAVQDHLTAEEKWLFSIKQSKNSLDNFKVLLGIPPDAEVELNKKDLDKVSDLFLTRLQKNAEFTLYTPSDELELIQAALKQRLDLKVAIAEMEDAQRNIIILADALGAELTLLGSASIGESRSLDSANQENAKISTGKGLYSAFLTVDLPFERTSERTAYRNGYIALERSVRRVQILEDEIKRSVREKLRELKESEERLKIQYKALRLAEKRIKSTSLFFEAGRAELKDILDARASLLESQNSLSGAAIDFVSAKLELLRDVGLIDPGTVVEMNLFKIN